MADQATMGNKVDGTRGNSTLIGSAFLTYLVANGPFLKFRKK